MMSSDIPNKIPEDIAIKKELSAAFIRIGLLTVSIGFACILLGLWLKNQLKAEPLLIILPLLVGLPIVMIINLIIIRRTLVKINSQSRK
jgi:hypothetical protein